MIVLTRSQYGQRSGGSSFYRYCVVTEKGESKATQKKDSMGTTMVDVQRKPWCGQYPTPRRQKRIYKMFLRMTPEVFGERLALVEGDIRKQDTVMRDTVPPPPPNPPPT